MSLDLDRRQRAMLAEMGVSVWTPEPVTVPVRTMETPRVATPVASPEPARSAAERTPESIADSDLLTLERGQKDSKIPAEGRATAISGVAPVGPGPGAALQPLPAGIEQMDWPALQNAVTHCRACALCHGRTNTVFGVGDAGADWMVIGASITTDAGV